MKDFIKRINWKSVIVRVAIYAGTLILSELGIACYYACGLGTDPISVFVDGQHLMMKLSYGTISTINSAVLTILILIFERKHLGIGTILTVFIGGPFIDIFTNILQTAHPIDTTNVYIKVAILVFGAIIFGLTTGACIGCELGIGPFSLPPIWLADLTGIDLKYTQMITDFMFLVIGWLLGGVVGIGTVVGVLSCGPILGVTLDWTNKLMEKVGPMLYEKEAE